MVERYLPRDHFGDMSDSQRQHISLLAQRKSAGPMIQRLKDQNLHRLNFFSPLGKVDLHVVLYLMKE